MSSPTRTFPQTPTSVDQEPRVRLVYFEEGVRIVTIAYQLYHDLPKKNLKFAASIFKKESEKEAFVRKALAHTATQRLAKRPLWTTFAPERYDLDDNYDRAFYDELKTHLRKEVHKRGVRSKQRLPLPLNSARTASIEQSPLLSVARDVSPPSYPATFVA